MEYVVTWTIDIDADSPEQAAQIARKIQLDPQSIATVFDVRYEDPECNEKSNCKCENVEIDLEKIPANKRFMGG